MKIKFQKSIGHLFVCLNGHLQRRMSSILDHATNRLFLDQLFFDQLTKLFTRLKAAYFRLSKGNWFINIDTAVGKLN